MIRAILLTLLVACALPVPVRAQAARVQAVDGALLARAPGQASWQSLRAGDTVASGQLVVALPQAELVSPNKAVRALMLTDLGQLTPFPVLESAITLYTPEDGVDLDIGLDRGIVGVTTLRENGSAKVRFRFRDQRWELTLKKPSAATKDKYTSVGIEIYSRQAPGLRKDFAKGDDPVTNVAFIVTKGEAFLDLGEEGHALRAAPGTAMVLWDTVSRMPELRDLDKAPRSLRDRNPGEQKLFEQMCHCGKGLAAGDPAAAAEKLVASDDLVDRRDGVTSLGALDALPGLFKALADPHPDVRDHAVVVFRHWLGRAPGQVGRLQAMLKQHGAKETNARTLLQLLIGFNEEERNRPATYELLLDELDHSQPAVRQLAHWHLVRLAPAGRDIPYDPTAEVAARAPAIEAWHKIIPAGELPRRTK